MQQAPKSIYWVASSKKDLMAMPEPVKDTFGYALHLAEIGLKHEAAKPLKGFGSAGVLEVVEGHAGGTCCTAGRARSANQSAVRRRECPAEVLVQLYSVQM